VDDGGDSRDEVGGERRGVVSKEEEEVDTTDDPEM
jgi:hypothetical protein